MALFIERHRAQKALEELAPIITHRVEAELKIIHVSIGYGIQITLKQTPAPNFEWIAVFRGIPVIYNQDGCDLY